MSAFYPYGLSAIASAYFVGPAPTGLSLNVVGVTADYVFSEVHQVFADIDPAHICMESVEVPNHVINLGGILDADDVRFIRPDAAETCVALIVYTIHDSGTQLLAYLSAGESNTIPLLLVGTDVIVRWTESGIFYI